MFTQEIGARRGSRRAVAALVALALAATVLAVAIEASSIMSAPIGSEVQRVPPQPARTANGEVPTSIRTPKGCRRRKFGCGQATPTANPDRRTGGHISKGCWRRNVGCGVDATTTTASP